MKNFIKTFFAVLAANIVLLAIVILFFAAVGAGMKAGKAEEIQKGTYLVIDISGEILAYDPPDSFPESILAGEPETLHRILSNLEKARVDDRIAGVILRLSGNNMGPAMIEEVRDEIKKIRDADKPVYGYAEGYLDRSGLYLAAACNSIFMPPPGGLVYVGYGRVVPYVKGTLEKLGIKANIHKIKDYKSAAELVTRKDMSPETREMYSWIIDDLWEMEMAATTADLGLSEEKLVEHMEYALFTPDEAQNAGLIDEVLYWSDLEDRLKGEDDDELKTVSQSAYSKVTRESVGLKGKRRIAVVHAHGMIGGRKSRIDPMFGLVMGYETVSGSLRAAAEDDKVEAIVFRVNSNGGESLASDLISHTVEEIAEEKPVIVSMIDVAASGGYMIAYRGTKILADPATITGSIGSISGKFNTTGFYDKLGISFDSITKGPNGLMWSEQTDFTPAQRRRFEENHWAGFNWWLEDVADRRGMTFEEAEKLAHGRVWTGKQAKENGLIDELGGLARAIELAKDAAGIAADEEVTLVHYPKKKGFMESLLSGESPFSTTLRWALYKFIHEDLEESYGLLTNAALNAWVDETAPVANGVGR